MLDETVRRSCNGQLLDGSDTDRNTARREDNDRLRYADRNRNDMENRYGQVRRDGDDRRGRDDGNMRQDRDNRYGNSREGERSEQRRCGCNSGRDNNRNRGPVYGFPNGVGRMGPTGCVGPVPRFGSCCLNGYGMPRTGLGSCCAGRSGNSYDNNDRSARERSCGCGREREGCSGESLLDTIQTLDFALFEVTLYLDAYCDDCQALELYHRLLEQRRVAAEKYEAEIGPLTFRGNRSCTQWDWVNQPYPWDIRANK